MLRTWTLLVAPLFAAAIVMGCSGDDDSTPGSGGSGGSPSTSASTSGGTTSSTGPGGGAGGGGGGSAEFPWEGHIDLNGGPSSGRLKAHELGTTTAPQGFYEYVPAGYPDGVKWPLLVANHGIGENGNGMGELSKVLNTGIPDLIEKDQWPNARPFVVLMPQHPGGGCPGSGEIQMFIDWALKNYAIDPRFVYLTGLSCGAIGSWGYLADNLDSQIAAFVPVAGDGAGAWNAKGCELGKVAVWGFHGDADGTVNVSGTNIPLDGLAMCPKPPAMESKKTIYPGVGHDSWTMTYDGSAGHDIYTWMLGFKKP
jgi:hypothetical protein